MHMFNYSLYVSLHVDIVRGSVLEAHSLHNLCMSHGGTIHSSPVCMLVSTGGFELGVPNV